MGFFKKSRLAEIERQEEEAPRKHGVLLVDDEDANLQTLSFAFGRHYEVFKARDGQEALAMMEDPAVSSKVQLVLSDQRMPNLSGVEFFMRLLDIAPSVIRILVTGYADMQSIIDSINKAHIYQFLLKPVDTDELLVTVRRALEAYDMREKLEEYHRGLEKLVAQRTQELERANEELRAEHRRLSRAQSQLIMQEKMAFLGTLTGGVAHELKNPLNFIINFSGAMNDVIESTLEGQAGVSSVMDSVIDPMTGDTVREVMKDLQRSADRVLFHGQRANEVISMMARLSHHKVSAREPTDLNRLVAKYIHLTYKSIKQLLADVDIEFVNDFDDGVGQVPVSEVSFGRVLASMITNSCEALADKHGQAEEGFSPQVRLTTRKLDDSVEIRVWDNGLGIPEGRLKEIFHPFFTTKAGPKNIGLGLSIAYDIVVQEYGGQLEVSGQEGEFTEFVVRLPLRPLDG